MYTLQRQIRDAVKTPMFRDVVTWRGNFTGQHMRNKECVGLIGSLAECMRVIAHVIKEMATALSSVAAQSGNPDFTTTAQEFIDTELLFGQNVDTLLDYRIEVMGMYYIIYWPSLEPIK